MGWLGESLVLAGLAHAPLVSCGSGGDSTDAGGLAQMLGVRWLAAGLGRPWVSSKLS